MFVIAGKNDPRVPASESEQIVKRVRQNNTPVWWLEANDEGHGFKKKNRDFRFCATVMFVQESRRSELLLQVGGDLLTVKPAIFNEDFIGSRTSDDHSGNIDSRHIALESLRVAHWAALV